MAAVDADGKFRAVISTVDPGVPNWLDTGGQTTGHVLARWMHTSDAPLPTVTVVKVAEVREYLPSDTPVVSADERDAAIRRRRRGAQMRKRW
jgi:hypothetical protein